MPAVVNIAANLLLGSGIALTARNSPALRRELANWSLLFLVGFEAVIFTPVAAFLFRFYPQWSMLYGFDPQVSPGLDRVVAWLSLAAVLLNFAAAVGAYAVVRFSILTGRKWLTALPIGMGALVIVYVCLAYGDRVAFMGDYDEFWQGNAVLFLRRLAGWLGIGLYAATVAFVYWVHRRYGRRDPRLL